jgi:hypothetical protein
VKIANYSLDGSTDPTDPCQIFTTHDISHYYSPVAISESEVSADTFSPIPTSIELPSPIRPHSSPSTFYRYTPEPPPRRLSAEGLGIDALVREQTTISSPHLQHTPLVSASPQTLPVPRRYYTPIAPNPVGLRQLQASKRSHSSEDEADSPSKKRKLSETSSPAIPIEISEDDNFLLRLKDEEGLSWKDIASRFHSDLGKTVQIPALQMRLKRLRERMKVWTEMDVQALKLSFDFYVNSKFDIIASKVCCRNPTLMIKTP